MPVSWRKGTGRKEGKREAGSGKRIAWGPWTGPLGNKKPRMANHTGREVNEALTYSRPDARAETSIRRKQTRQRARKPKARRRGFMAWNGPDYSGNARRAFKVGFPLPPISRHAATHDSPSWFQLEAPSMVARHEARKRSSFSGLDAQGSTEIFSR